MTRFASSPPWRFLVTDLNGVPITFLDRLAGSRSLTYGLNSAGTATLSVPSESPEINILHVDAFSNKRPFVSNNDRLLYGFRRDFADGVTPWTCRFGGVIGQVHDTADVDRAVTQITAYDPWQLLYTHPLVINGAGDLPGTTGYKIPLDYGSITARKILEDSQTAHGTLRIDAGLPYGGTSYNLGPFEATDQETFTFANGISVGEAWAQIVATGSIDLVLRPIYDPVRRPGILAELAVYKVAGNVFNPTIGNPNTPRSDAVFAWDRPSKSLIAIDRLVDGAQLANKALFFNGQGGPPVIASAVGSTPGASIPATDPQLYYDTPLGVPEEPLSVQQYGQYWTTQAFPKQPYPDPVDAFAIQQVALRSQGKTTVAFTPTPERAPDPFNEFFLGDLVPVYASNRLRDSIPPASPPNLNVDYVRVYGFTVNVSDDGLESVQMLVSPQGFTASATPGTVKVTLVTRTTSTTTSKLKKPLQ